MSAVGSIKIVRNVPGIMAGRTYFISLTKGINHSPAIQ